MEEEEDEVASFFFHGRKYARTRAWCVRCVVVILMFESFT